MIRLVDQGKYTLQATKKLTKILFLNDKKIYVWINAEGIGEILLTTNKDHMANYILAKGNYRLYEVKDEPELTDLLHLELFVGDGNWQGYLLPTGLPTSKNNRNRIIATKEIITK